MFYSKIHIPEISSYVLPVTAMGLNAELQQEPWLFSFCATLALQTHAHTKRHGETVYIPVSITAHATVLTTGVER